MMGPIVDFVHLRAKYGAPIPDVPSLAQSLVRHAPKIVRGRALTPDSAICRALFLAANCHARSVAS